MAKTYRAHAAAIVRAGPARFPSLRQRFRCPPVARLPECEPALGLFRLVPAPRRRFRAERFRSARRPVLTLCGPFFCLQPNSARLIGLHDHIRNRESPLHPRGTLPPVRRVGRPPHPQRQVHRRPADRVASVLRRQGRTARGHLGQALYPGIVRALGRPAVGDVPMIRNAVLAGLVALMITSLIALAIAVLFALLHWVFNL